MKTKRKMKRTKSKRGGSQALKKSFDKSAEAAQKGVSSTLELTDAAIQRAPVSALRALNLGFNTADIILRIASAATITCGEIALASINILKKRFLKTLEDIESCNELQDKSIFLNCIQEKIKNFNKHILTDKQKEIDNIKLRAKIVSTNIDDYLKILGCSNLIPYMSFSPIRCIYAKDARLSIFLTNKKRLLKDLDMRLNSEYKKDVMYRNALSSIHTLNKDLNTIKEKTKEYLGKINIPYEESVYKPFEEKLFEIQESLDKMLKDIQDKKMKDADEEMRIKMEEEQKIREEKREQEAKKIQDELIKKEEEAKNLSIEQLTSALEISEKDQSLKTIPKDEDIPQLSNENRIQTRKNVRKIFSEQNRNKARAYRNSKKNIPVNSGNSVISSNTKNVLTQNVPVNGSNVTKSNNLQVNPGNGVISSNTKNVLTRNVQVNS